MNSNLNQLDYILNIDKFQKIQDDIAKATGMAVIAIDYTGKPITKHSYCSSFCTMVRLNPELRKLCEKCDSRGGLEAARDQGAYIYLCHFGIVDIAIPIVVDGQYLGAIMAGQVLEEDSENSELERIVSKKYQLSLENYPELKNEYQKLNSMSIDKINAIANMINRLINYIVGEAQLKTTLYDSNPDLKNGHKATLLKPALKYIDEHYKEKLYMDNMAYLCNISSGYFSKIFKIETGENFSNYVNIVKLNKAMEILETSDEPIANIALDLGFEDCGYFIKVFKKHVGDTPANYRNSKIMNKN
ncbi:MAG: PocR ligand-binding domain-containing protein [Spirochaetales bacterium]|nr:PocR ligand-binding domain-containing protein [Spirochaetales bacterium]